MLLEITFNVKNEHLNYLNTYDTKKRCVILRLNVPNFVFLFVKKSYFQAKMQKIRNFHKKFNLLQFLP